MFIKVSIIALKLQLDVVKIILLVLNIHFFYHFVSILSGIIYACSGLTTRFYTSFVIYFTFICVKCIKITRCANTYSSIDYHYRQNYRKNSVNIDHAPTIG